MNPSEPVRAVNGLGFAGRLAAGWIESPLTPLIILTSIALGVAAVLGLPREEEPQIRVPMIDVFCDAPGWSASAVERLVTGPAERWTWEIPGVEYVYSTSREGQCLLIVRFEVGEDVERSLVKLTEKLRSRWDRMPAAVQPPRFKPRSIDDVPILALTLRGDAVSPLELRQAAAALRRAIAPLPNVAEVHLIGGARRELRVELDPLALAARGVAGIEVVSAIQEANLRAQVGRLTANNLSMSVEAGSRFNALYELENLVVGMHGGAPVSLREVARVVDGPEEPIDYVFSAARGQEATPAVTITVSKRPGANAIAVADAVLSQVARERDAWFPESVELNITRHYGDTAAEKSNELLLHMAIAVVGVSALIWIVLGWRESVVVAIAIPVTLALTLLVFFLYGFTLNRITLFALIFSIGILVDDAIVVVENIVRHRRLPGNRGRSLRDITVEAVSEVGNPTILATFAVVFAVLPMAFVGGLMGPYMRPIPIGASAAMVFSLLVAFMVTPWAARRVFQWRASADSLNEDAHSKEDRVTRWYRSWMDRLIHRAGWRWAFLVGSVVALGLALSTVVWGWTKMKMLPFDNKSEFQIILNMPEGTALERTSQVAQEIAVAVGQEPEVVDTQVYVGTSAPYNFNGLVRHYFLRQSPEMADVQVNLAPKHARSTQSHAIAKRVRPAVTAIAKKYGARVAVSETPPGPPSLQTLVAEVYGPDASSRDALAARVLEIFETTDGVVDVDTYREEPVIEQRLAIRRDLMGPLGAEPESVLATAALFVGGRAVEVWDTEDAQESVRLRVQGRVQDRGSLEAALAAQVPLPGGLVPLGELVSVVEETVDAAIYHKNLWPVTYVIGDVAGGYESPFFAINAMGKRLRELDARAFGSEEPTLNVHHLGMPKTDAVPSVKWDGEWHITLEVFRDMGLAFAVVLVLIYVLMVGWFKSYLTPLVVMSAIPFSLVGILPAHGALGAFFTATSMIGFMAGAGIVTRNSIILVDFIELRLREGMPLDQAVIDAGAVRFRPMLLTAMAVVVGASVILADPIFQGLAIALMAGEIAALSISRVATPLLYYMLWNRPPRPVLR